MLEVVANICSNVNCGCLTSESGYCGENCRKQDDDPDCTDYCYCAHKGCSELSDEVDDDLSA